ncbi:MAG: FKBP-type peptidyl-prolyl cis-trans isomerase [Bacteroidales bacterium]|jgi:FKBP-type peptidyl-prolyl cis-trans isomerase SlyD|nr:FKBP-type peptidyl-prolyl cis-trans isomerase [Bacteroidales bacterium]MDD3700950.1 FKBP-type peptidyl-prolyl cis-trans isomerase [Bacteroidales bacterium]MDY0370236.1 FKBP-type peptidyl-prolyl cis-trans isomerase [Bacteroidales bacterium]
MKIGNNKVVSLIYELRENDAQGELIQKVEKDHPFVYLFGVGGLLPVFEQNLNGLQPGDTFSFSMKADESYGQRTEEAIIELDKQLFEIDGVIDEELLTIGNQLTMQDHEGNPLEGTVLEVTDYKVIMDFNHPLAGFNLHFSGLVLEVRDASQEEIAHGHVHGPHGHHH